MTPPNVRGLAAALLALTAATATTACRTAGSATTIASPVPTPAAQQAERPRAVGGTPSGIAQARADSVRHPWTAADARFMTMMIGHHAQAITMARMAPTHGASASVQRLAARIINAQVDEIATMQAWLRDRRQPAPDVRADGTVVESAAGGHAAGHAATGHDAHAAHGGTGAAMPMHGMLTTAQLAQLDRARGAEFDRLFLTFMIQHHRGAVGMVQELFDTDGAGQDETIFKFASDVNVDQTTEIARMEQMLAALLFEGRAP